MAALSHFPSRYMDGGNAVAGSAAEGHGILIAFEGKGAITRSRLGEIATIAEVPTAWLPAPKEPGVQLTRAIQDVAGGDYDAKREKKKDRLDPNEREWSSRWLLVTRIPEGTAPRAPGQPYGEIALVATLYKVRNTEGDGYTAELVFAGDATLAERVKTEYDARCAAVLYEAADVSGWLAELIKFRLDGVKHGTGWYVPREHRTHAELIVSVFSGRPLGEMFGAPLWGAGWTIPLPIATCEQLAMSITLGLSGEVDAVMLELAKMRQTARDNGKPDITERGAVAVMVRLRAVGERVAMFADRIGDEHTKLCQERLHDSMVELDGLLGAADFATEWTAIVQSREQRENDRAMLTDFSGPGEAS